MMILGVRPPPAGENTSLPQRADPEVKMTSEAGAEDWTVLIMKENKLNI